jgi:hypothetical protein
VEQLCKGFPVEFAQYLNYCRYLDLSISFIQSFYFIRSLHFEDKPDYAYLRKLFRELFIKENFKYDAMFDWAILKQVKPLHC